MTTFYLIGFIVFSIAFVLYLRPVRKDKPVVVQDLLGKSKPIEPDAIAQIKEAVGPVSTFQIKFWDYVVGKYGYYPKNDHRIGSPSYFNEDKEFALYCKRRKAMS